MIQPNNQIGKLLDASKKRRKQPRKITKEANSYCNDSTGGLPEGLSGLSPDGTGGFRAGLRLDCCNTETIVRTGLYALRGFKMM